jgi:hypothetical protein
MVRRVLAIAVFAAALIAGQSAASAHHRVHVSGRYVVSDFGSTACAPKGSPFILRCTTTGFVSQYSGSLTGSSVADFKQTINCNKSRTHGRGIETFTGSIEGVGSGTLTWRIRFRSAFDCATFAVSNFVGRGVIISGTGALANLRGRLHFGDVSYHGNLRQRDEGDRD